MPLCLTDTTLAMLRESIGQAWNLPPTSLRLFSFGRELRNVHKSLDKLGLDKFGAGAVILVHAGEHSSRMEDDVEIVEAPMAKNRRVYELS